MQGMIRGVLSMASLSPLRGVATGACTRSAAQAAAVFITPQRGCSLALSVWGRGCWWPHWRCEGLACCSGVGRLWGCPVRWRVVLLRLILKEIDLVVLKAG